MKIMFSAGEASGDTHGASVAKALSQIDSNIEMFGMGGTLMEQAGVRIVYDIKNLGVIGIVEIIKSLPKFFKLRTYLKRVMLKEKPDVLVCIDYPGFNMIAAVARRLRNLLQRWPLFFRLKQKHIASSIVMWNLWGTH